MVAADVLLNSFPEARPDWWLVVRSHHGSVEGTGTQTCVLASAFLIAHVCVGCATLTEVEHVTDLARWRELLPPPHQWDTNKLLYKGTYVKKLEQVSRVNPVP